MILASEHLDPAVRVATVMVPVAVYFLILGLLNSGRHPHLLTGRRDFGLLIVALSPLFVLPALEYLGMSLLTAGALVVALGCVIWLLAPRGAMWVIYNMAIDDARVAVGHALGSLELGVQADGRGFRLPEQGAVVEVGGFPLLRNVSIRLRGGRQDLARRFEAALAGNLASVPAQTHPMAAGMLLVAIAMMITPLALTAHRAPEIVRILTDLLD